MDEIKTLQIEMSENKIKQNDCVIIGMSYGHFMFNDHLQ